MIFIIVCMVSWIGMYGTFWVSEHLGQGGVRASATLSLLVAIICYNLPTEVNEFYREQIPVIFFGASFMGMVSKEIMASWHLFLLSSIVFALVFTGLDNVFIGFGGGLGTKACISIIAVLGLDYLWLILKNRFPLP